MTFDLSLTMSYGKKLEEFGFRWDGIRTTSDFMEEIARLTPRAKENNKSFMQMLYSKNWFSYLLAESGVPLLDYETGKVLPDEKGLREFLEGYKAYFPYDYDETVPKTFINYGSNALASGVCAFWFPFHVDDIVTTMSMMKEKSYDYVLHAIPSQSGDVVATIGQIAISANAKNPLNAYRFIKFMLSEDAQKDKYMQISGIPIHKNAITKSIFGSFNLADGGMEFKGNEDSPLSDEEIEMVIRTLTGADRYTQRVSEYLSDAMLESMLPYFKDERSYDACLKDLKNKLMLYLSE